MTSFTHPVERGDPIAAFPTLTMLPLDQIHPSPFNARKTFDGIDELAASIKEQGLLENLVVRPIFVADQVDHYELIAGERRLRALQQLKETSAPVRVIQADDARAMAAQIVENLQRADIPPLEEAEAFKRLQGTDPKKWTAAEIGRAIGKTDRFVSQRLSLVTRLEPAGRKLLEKGELTVEQARVIASAPKHIQTEVLKTHWIVGASAERLREHILAQLVPIERAAFDLKDYSGGYHEDGKKRFFTDTAQFDRLQRAQALAVVKELRTAWPKAEVVNENDLHDWAWADTGKSLQYPEHKGDVATGKFKVAREKCAAIVWIDRTARLRKAEGVAPRRLVQPRSTFSSSGPTETKAEKEVRHAFNAAVRAAARSKPTIALALLLTNFIDGVTRCSYDHNAVNKAHAEILPQELQAFTGKYLECAEKQKLFKAVCGLAPAKVTEMVAAYTGMSLNWEMGHGKKPKPFAAAVAAELGVKPGMPEKTKAKAKPKAAAKKKGGKK